MDTKTNNITFSAWVKVPSTMSAVGTIISKSRYAYSAGRWSVGITSTGKISLFLASDGTVDYDAAVGTTDLRDGLWHHVALVLVRDGNAYAYVDGVLDGTTVISAQFKSSSNYNSTAHVLIGAYGDESGLGVAKSGILFFKGNIDELAVWNRSLNSTEILGLYNSQSLKFNKNLLGLWHLNDKNAQGGVLNSVTYVRDGSLTGGADINARGLCDRIVTGKQIGRAHV